VRKGERLRGMTENQLASLSRSSTTLHFESERREGIYLDRDDLAVVPLDGERQTEDTVARLDHLSFPNGIGAWSCRKNKEV